MMRRDGGVEMGEGERDVVDKLLRVDCGGAQLD